MNFLFKRLVIPLSAGGGSVDVGQLVRPDPWRSLLVNLAATFLGSIVTVFFVDAILRRGEEERWKKFQGHAGKQISILGIGTSFERPQRTRFAPLVKHQEEERPPRSGK
jgi:hypothetical protein